VDAPGDEGAGWYSVSLSVGNPAAHVTRRHRADGKPVGAENRHPREPDVGCVSYACTP